MAKDDIGNFLDEKDNDIPDDNRFGGLGNGIFTLRALTHDWKVNDNVGTFVAEIEVVDSQPIAGGLRSWRGEPIEMQAAGDRSSIVIWGFGKSDRHRMAMGKLKSYLGALLAHKGISAKGKHNFSKMATQLVKNRDKEEVKSLYRDTTFKIKCEVKAPKDGSGPDGKPWRLISYL